MPRLNELQIEAAHKIAKEVFEWERLAEEHSAVLRRDPNQMAEAHAQYARDAPPAGSVPPQAQWDLWIENVGQTLNETLSQQDLTFFEYEIPRLFRIVITT